jgi:hypothetical protein
VLGQVTVTSIVLEATSDPERLSFVITEYVPGSVSDHDPTARNGLVQRHTALVEDRRLRSALLLRGDLDPIGAGVGAGRDGPGDRRGRRDGDRARQRAISGRGRRRRPACVVAGDPVCGSSIEPR